MKNKKLNIAIYQMYAVVGDFTHNVKKIIAFIEKNKDKDLIVLPELALTGYSPLDELYTPEFQTLVFTSIYQIKEVTLNIKATVILGTPYFLENQIHNVALVIANSKINEVIYKSKFPNNGVFNESRYFTPHTTKNTVVINDVCIGIGICEDLWHQDKLQEICNHHIDILISINGSVFDSTKVEQRLAVCKNLYNYKNIPLIYVNLVSANDDLIFDGSSFVLNSVGENLGHLKHVEEDSAHLVYENNTISSITPLNCQEYAKEELIYKALVFGIKEFIINSGFKGALIGMSGGIDSTLCATLAVDALGAENVIGIAMPSQYTSQLSTNIIEDIKNKLNINIINVPIDTISSAYEESLQKVLNYNSNNISENIQSRIRGQILMSFSSFYPNFMVLTTGNKSELATGYCTLYGDTCGGFNPLKDLYKTQVFALCKYRNSHIPNNTLYPHLNIIPQEAITRKPSAELKQNQFDEDSLMEYELLDNILYSIIEEYAPLDYLYKKFNVTSVNKVLNLIRKSHFKRVQSAPGLKVSTRAFGKDYLYPLAHKFTRK